MPSIEIQSAILCDEVRREYDDRATLLGVTMIGPPIDPNEGSIIKRLAFYMHAEIVDVKTVIFRLVNSEADDEAFLVEMEFDFPEAAEGVFVNPDGDEIDVRPESAKVGAAIVIQRESTKIATPGSYDLEYRIKGADTWQVAQSFLFPALPMPSDQIGESN